MSKYKFCPRCRGKGHIILHAETCPRPVPLVPCATCDASGKVSCPGGVGGSHGDADCGMCNGTGEDRDGDDPCEHCGKHPRCQWCKGKGKVPCACGGTGVRYCPDCNGRREVRQPNPPRDTPADAGAEPCAYCEAAVVVHLPCNGRGVVLREVEVQP